MYRSPCLCDEAVALLLRIVFKDGVMTDFVTGLHRQFRI